MAICWTSANAKIYDNRFKSTDDHSWIRRSREAPYDFASSSEPLPPSYASFLESRRNHRAAFDSSDSVKPKDWFSFSASKKVPTENKNLKKVSSPFYTITDKDSQKYKDMVMKSGVPYCQEIKTRRVNKDSDAKDSMICYKCKNPKNGASYEQCSYASQPSTGSSNVEQKPSRFRNRRSNSDEAFPGFKDYRRDDNPYRFNDKIFSEATDDVPAEYKNKNEKCEKVIKDSMMCMVCKDTKSNAKYEQCTYIRQPAEKKYTYTKSSSLKSPKESEENGKRSNRRYFETKPVKEEHSSSEDKEDKEEEKESREEYKDSTSNCKKIQKDSKTCTVCKDPKTGGNYERCSYAYEPNDKVYKFSRTKSFGYPASSSKDDDSSESSQDEEKRSKSELEEYKRDYSIPESYYDKSHSSPHLTTYFKDDESRPSYRQAASQNSKLISDDDDYLSGYEKSKSESEKVAKSIEPSHCKEVQKDSMTCKICKDPKTGSNSEQCSYKYQPSDKSYSYSKSRSIGSPTESNDKSYDESEKKETQKLPYEKEGYDYSSDKSSYITDQAGEREFPTSDESKSEVMEKPLKSAPKKSDVGFYDAFKKKEEIQKVLQEFQKEDRSNCKKLMRDKMTCYQCVDDNGFKKEECAFVTSEEPAEEKINREEPSKKIPRSVIENLDDVPIEPEAAASEKVYVQRELPPNKSSGKTEASKETEPYEYVEETKPVFDKILGFTLPAYMLSTSEHEEEFDKIMSGKI